jgi:hypothetical protein
VQKHVVSTISSACYLLPAGFLLGLFFDPEDGSDMFLKTQADFGQTTWYYIPEDRTLHTLHFLI